LASLIVVSIIFVVAIAMMIASVPLLASPLATSAGLFPIIVAAAMILVAGLIMAGDVRQLLLARAGGGGDEAPAAETLTGDRRQFALLGAWVLLGAVYAVATPLVGFEIATFVMLTVALKLFARASWKVIATVPIAVALTLPFVFRHLFHTLIP
jgi:hypothetical protein